MRSSNCPSRLIGLAAATAVVALACTDAPPAVPTGLHAPFDGTVHARTTFPQYRLDSMQATVAVGASFTPYVFIKDSATGPWHMCSQCWMSLADTTHASQAPADPDSAMKVTGKAVGTDSVTAGNGSTRYVVQLFTVTSGKLHFVGRFDGDSTVPVGTSYNVAKHFHFIVANARGDSVGSVPVVNLPSIQWTFQSGQAPPLGSEVCTVPTDVLVLNCPASSFPGSTSQAAYTGYFVVTVQEGSFNGITNPSYRGQFHLYVTQPAVSPVSLVGKFDGDSVVPIGTVYNVAQHFHFIVQDSHGDSLSSVPVVNLPSIQWTLQSGQAPPPGSQACGVPTGDLVLDCQASSFAGTPPYTGFYAVTVQSGSFNGIANPSYRGRFDLYVNSVQNSPLSFIGRFDGDSVVASGTAYDVTQHFHVVVQHAQGDSVNSVPVVKLPSIQWTLQSGQAPLSPPSCSVGTGVLVLNCPASSGNGFTGYYVVTVQQASFNGIANPSYRPTFDLFVSP